MKPVDLFRGNLLKIIIVGLWIEGGYALMMLNLVFPLFC
jgi:hypothetical protein